MGSAVYSLTHYRLGGDFRQAPYFFGASSASIAFLHFARSLTVKLRGKCPHTQAWTFSENITRLSDISRHARVHHIPHICSMGRENTLVVRRYSLD